MAAAHFLLALVCAPLLPAIIDWVSALIQGKARRPFFACYKELLALAERATAYPGHISVLSTSAAVVSLGCMASALSLMPIGGMPSLLSFSGDFVLVVFCLILARMVTLLAGEEGGPLYRNTAGREGAAAASCGRYAAVLAEPLLLLVFLPLGLAAGSYSLGGMLTTLRDMSWQADWPVLLPVAGALLCLALAEKRMAPAGDYDAMAHAAPDDAGNGKALPPGGLDRALREYGQALKFWFLAAALGGLFPPAVADPEHAFAAGVGGLCTAAIAIGLLDGLFARMPQRAKTRACTTPGTLFFGAALVCVLVAGFVACMTVRA